VVLKHNKPRLNGCIQPCRKRCSLPLPNGHKTAIVLDLDTSLIEKVTAETFPEPVKRAKGQG
jgi:hypothetical protein